MRLHLLAAEAAAHAQRLHGHLVRGDAENVADDVLGLGGVLGGAVDEDLPGLVDVGERGLGLQVEVLLAGEFEGSGHRALSRVGRRGGEGGGGVPAQHRGAVAVETVLRDGVGEGEHGVQRFVVDLDCRGAQAGGLEGLGEHPAHGVADEHGLAARGIGEEGFIVLRAGVVDAGDVGGGEDAHHAGDPVGGVDVEPEDPGVGVR